MGRVDQVCREYVRRGRQNVLSRAARAVDRGRVPDEVVIVAGSARSGTTWVAELLDHDGAFRYSFEPLHHATKDFRHFHTRQYVPVGSTNPALIDPLTRMMQGQVYAPYVDGWDPHPSLRPRNRLLLKIINGGLLLGWVLDNFPEARVVYVVREPLAVVASRGRLAWSNELDDLLSQSDLVSERLGHIAERIAASTSLIERELLVWCIENAVALEDLAGREQAMIVRYEDLLTRRDEVLPRVFEHVGRPWDPAVLASSATPSKSAWNGSGFVADPAAHANDWRVSLGDHETVAASLAASFGIPTLLAAATFGGDSLDDFETAR